MSYSITPSGDGKYIILKIWVDFTRELAIESIIASHALGKEMGIKRYLVEDHSHDFYEVIANNAGLNIKLFSDGESAVAHLHKD